MKFGIEIVAALVVAGMSIPAAEAHEFWIDGTVVEKDGASLLSLDLKVGQMLDGISLPYIPDTTEAFEWVHGGSGAISGEVGDIPAAQVPFDGKEGAVVFHRSAPRRLVHKDWAKFLEYLEMEGLEGIAEAHIGRGLPKTRFTETYARYAKFAFASSADEGIADRYVGSPIEIVLHQVRKRGGELTINGRVISDSDEGSRQVSVFYTSPDGATSFRIWSAQDGAFTISLPDNGPVLLNTVQMSAASAGVAEWHSDWASMFLRVR